MTANQKPPMCTNYFKCSIPKTIRNAWHARVYHNPKPVEIPNPFPFGDPFMMIYRDPNRNMFYPCPHPECDHTSILRSGPLQHQKTCQFFKRDRRSASASGTINAADALPQSGQNKRKLNNGPNSLPRKVALPRLTAAAFTTAQSSGSDSDYTPPGLNSKNDKSDSSNIYNKNLKSSSNNNNNNSIVSDAALRQIQRSMDHCANTVAGLSKRLKRQRASIDRMGEQMDWLADQVDEIRTQNAGLESHTEYLRIDAGLVEDHLGDLMQDNRKIKEQMRGLREDVGRVGLTFGGFRHQHQGSIYRYS